MRHELGLATSYTMSAHPTRGRPHVTRLTRWVPTNDRGSWISGTNDAREMHRATDEARLTEV